MATGGNHHSDEEEGEGEEDGDQRIFYKMDSEPRGYCIIVNNKNFTRDSSNADSKDLRNREGTDKDKDSLIEIFERLKFIVRVHTDLKDTEIVSVIRDIATKDHSDYDCLVVCLLSHGSLGHVYGVNGMPVPLKELTAHVKPINCVSLTGKPKLFFVQACQGESRQIGYPSLERDSAPMADAELVPNEGDFLLSYSTVPGFESYRDPDRGSTFIWTLTRYLRKYATQEDILHILTRVNNAVSRQHHTLEDNHAYKQCPAPLYSLRKKVFFGTGIDPSTLGVEGERRSSQTIPKTVEPDVTLGNSGPEMDPLKRKMSRVSLDVPPPTAAVPCEVTFTTGDGPEAETDAIITFTVFGIKGATLPTRLFPDSLNNVGSKRGGNDTIQLQLKDVAPVKKLRVCLDPGSGKKKLWSLKKVRLWNMSTFTETVFHCSGWLGTGREGAHTWLDIPAIECGKLLLQETTYKITVKTSKVRGAGTDANVFVVLFGVNGDSGELHLKKSETNKDPFENGHVDVFTIKNILSLGELYKLRVWHDNKNFGAAWHLSSIDVKDTTTSKEYSFSCGRWLSSKDDDHQTLREQTCTEPTGPSRNVVYEIEVKTSVEEGSGSVHNGWLVLEGDLATSQVFTLQNTPHDRILRRGQTNFFTLTSPPLGTLQTCKIGACKRQGRSIQDEKGSQVRWRCETVAVTDTSSGLRTAFLCEDWIDVLPGIPEDSGVMCYAARSDLTYWAKVRGQKAINYEVEVYTGDVPRGGTDANVSICIFGENGDTGKRPLKKPGRNLFEAGKGDSFVLEAVDLGELTQLHIEHDNSGIAAAWFLHHVIVTNKNTATPTYFHCCKWLNNESHNAQDLEPCRSALPQPSP